MFILKRNQVIVTALVVMIAVAGYLNFAESKNGESSETALILTDDGDLESALLSDSIATLPDDEEGISLMDPITAEAIAPEDIEDAELAAASAETDDTGAAIFVSASADSGTYFVQAKLEREQSRAKQKDILNEMLENKNIDETKKAECAGNMLKIQERIEKETAAEAMIEAKGFTEAYVRIDDDTVDVVVDKAELTEAELAQIEDIVSRKTGFKEDQIRISPLKK